MSIHNFNSTLVRLRHSASTAGLAGGLNFNSTLVRLRLEQVGNTIVDAMLFQFYISTIKTNLVPLPLK